METFKLMHSMRKIAICKKELLEGLINISLENKFDFSYQASGIL